MVSKIQLCKDGPVFSRLVHGMWRLAEWGMSTSQLAALVQFDLEHGITTFDHADIYGDYTCEALFGELLADSPALREQLQIVTKCGIRPVSDARPENRIKHYDTSSEHIIASAENSLSQLRTDRIDLLLIHRPDPLMHADEIADAFRQLRDAGKVLHFGVSNFAPGQFDLLVSRLDFPLATNQVELSVIHLESIQDGTLDHCQRRRMSPMIWSPLGGGRLFADASEHARRIRNALESVGQEVGGIGIDQTAVAWLLTHPARAIPILGTRNQERLKKSIAAESMVLNRQQWFKIWTASTGVDVA